MIINLYGLKFAAVSNKCNFRFPALLKTAIVPIKVTESSARMRAKSGDHGNHISHYAVASLRKHNG